VSIERARLSVEFYLSRVQAQTIELRAREHPRNDPSPVKWLSLVGGLIDTANDYLEQSQAAGSPPTTVESLVRDAARLAQFAYDCPAYLGSFGPDDLPVPLVRPFQRWFEQLNLPNTTLFRADQQPNYELSPTPRHLFDSIRGKSASLTDAIAAIDWPLLQVTVPSKALGLIPHFSIVAHEIGHAVFPKISWDLTAHNPAWDDLIQRIARHLGASRATPSAVSFTQKVFSNWFEEIVSDALAYLMTGPAFFFALCDFFQLSGSGHRISDTHPPPELRRRLVFERTQLGGPPTFESVIHAHTGEDLVDDFNSSLLLRLPSVDQIAADLSVSLPDQEHAAALAELIPFCVNIAGTIYQQVEAYLSSNAPATIYSPDRLDQDLKAHLDALREAIPPIESGADLNTKVPTDFASILNVGWIVLLVELRDLRVRPSGDGKFGSDSAESLHSLLLKAVELSEVRRLWDNV
jgi:hypothetical protein